MCLICRASVIAKVELFQHLYALTVSGPSPASWRTQSGKVQLGERWTSLFLLKALGRSAGPGRGRGASTTSSINSILPGPAVCPWGPSAYDLDTHWTSLCNFKEVMS